MMKLRDKLDRLRDMSGNELLHRIVERLSRRVDHARTFYYRSRKPGWRFVRRLLDQRGQGPTVLRYLERTAAPRFYLPSSAAHRAELIEAIRTRFPCEAHEAVEEARQLCENRVRLLGFGEVALGDDVDWHRDPVTGVRWPRRFGANYDLVARDNVGDPKIIHELNRHQHLPRLGKAFALTGDERFARHALAHIESWIEQNPENRGVNWSSSLEIAIRSLSWLWTLFFILPSEALNERAARRILGSLFAQLHHVHRYLSIYTSPNTHLLGEATALFIAGQVFRGLPFADEWSERGFELIVDEIERQDVGGVHAELSSYYHCYTVDFFLQAAILAHRNGTTLPDSLWRRLEDEIDFVAHLTRPDGTIPLLGDDDGGRALALSAPDYRSFTDALSTGAVLFARPDWKWAGGALHEETLWLLGADARERYWALEPATPIRRHDDRVDASYFVQRTGWGPRDAHLTFDCGGLGFLGGGHGHADALSVTAYGPEGEILADPGTFVYNLQPRWRDYFRSTAAHNTVVIDGQDQSKPRGTFRWEAPGRAQLSGRHDEGWLQFIEGYCENDETSSARHRRRVLHIDGEYWLIFDDVGPDDGADHDVELFYHFAPELHPLELERQEDDHVVHVGSASTGSVFGLTVCGAAPFEAEVIRGRADPPQGWVSRRYGEREEAPTLRAACRGTLPAVFVTLLAPFGAGLGTRLTDVEGRASDLDAVPLIRLRHAEPGTSVVLTVETPQYTDWIIASPVGRSVRFPHGEAAGELVWLRSRGERLDRFFARGASYLRVRDRVLFDTETPIPHLAQIVEPHSKRPSGPRSMLRSSSSNPNRAAMS